MLVRVDLRQLVIHESYEEQRILLAETAGLRQLCITVGIFEALALDSALKQSRSPRPLTHDLLRACVTALEGELKQVVIHHFEEGTFFATAHLRTPKGIVEVDARPSDALTWAQLTSAPIFVESGIFESAGSPQVPLE